MHAWLIARINVQVTSWSLALRAKHCWQKIAPALSAFTTSMRLNERTLLTCMCYVEGLPFGYLNPIRAGMAKALQDSEFTSIQERIEYISTWLSGFGKSEKDLPFYPSSYIDLVDETERCLRDDAYMDVVVSREQDAVATKHGYISKTTSKAIDQTGINPDCWIDELKGFKSIGFYSYHP